MKKLLPLALLGAAIGATAFILNKNNKQHIEATLEKLDEISRRATETVGELADEVIEKINSAI